MTDALPARNHGASVSFTESIIARQGNRQEGTPCHRSVDRLATALRFRYAATLQRPEQ